MNDVEEEEVEEVNGDLIGCDGVASTRSLFSHTLPVDGGRGRPER